jgi:hypothetical protein
MEDPHIFDIRNERTFNSIKKHFISYIDTSSTCWGWKGVLDRQKYGIIKIASRTYKAHRLSYMLFNGPIYAHQIVRHTCDNPSCVNPKHLIKGNESDNLIDCVKRNRHPNTKLNEEAVKVIKWMLKYEYKKGLIKKLAELHKVNIKTISDINCNHCWNWVKI